MPPPDSPPRPILPGLAVLALLLLLLLPPPSLAAGGGGGGEELAYLWPLPAEFNTGADTLSVDPYLALVVGGNGGGSRIVKDAFDRYKSIIFQHSGVFSIFNTFRKKASGYDIGRLRIVVRSASEELQLGVDESYTLLVTKSDGKSIIGEATIEANTVYGALRGLEKFMVYKKTEGTLQAKCKLVLGTTFYAANSQFSSTITHFCVRGITFSQLCTFDYSTKSVLVHKAPWYIRDEPRFAYRGLLLDTSRHYYPVEVIKHILDSMSYAKLNVLHWHIIDEQSFPLEVPTYPKLWQGAYTRWERYTVEDAYEIVNFAKSRGIHVMPEVDVPGHAESWGKGYPELWPSTSCREPLDVSKSTTFDLISGLLSDMRKIFPFELFHLGGDEVNTDCWTSTPHVKQWLQNHNMTSKDAYEYFVLKAQEIAISKNWTPVNWEETFNAFPKSLNPRTIVHNWLGAGVCPKAVAKGFKCIFSNQGFWYLDHLDVPWDQVYTAEPLEGISDASKQKLVIGGEVCMWGEITDTSNVQQTIWPRAAAAAERLWSRRDTISTGNVNETALPRLHYFRCLLNGRGVAAAPVTNQYARSQPNGPASCYAQ